MFAEMGTTPFDPLEANLLDLMHELRGTQIRLILGGGYGLYLKQRHLRGTGERTLLDSLPDARSTRDLDLFLRTEIIADPDRTRLLAAALDRLGCQPVETARYFQFARRFLVSGEWREVKFDILTGPAHPTVDIRRIRRDPRRWRPRGEKIRLHAHPTPEAIAIEEDLIEIPLDGQRTTGQPHRASIFLPQPFTYALMKLFAFRDRKDDTAEDFGRHHALDLYTIVAMATEAEWGTATRLSRAYREESAVREASNIVQQYFSRIESIGTIRLREHPQFSPALDLPGFVSALAELFSRV
jgi:hypothetical protein